MICRTCLRRASALIRSAPFIATRRPFSAAAPRWNTAAAAAAATEATPEQEASASTAPPQLINPLGGLAGEPAKPALSSCPAGTVLNGLNYLKGKTDPVARADDEYPDWLWKCIEITIKKEEAADTDGGDEFSKSKKQRRLAAKKKRQLEEKLLAAGDLEALAPKIPLQQQTINLPGGEDDTTEGAVFAAEKRVELRRAMRKERRSKIKESNYLKSM